MPIRYRVQHDFELTTGGPGFSKKRIMIFREGIFLTVHRTTLFGEYPKMYCIEEYPQLGEISRAILSQFLIGFEPDSEPG